MKKILIALLLGLSVVAWAEAEPARELRTPAELAAESDYVVLARLELYDYETRRDIPVEGKTWFDVLVPYKVPRPTHRVRVIEEGFGDDKCYFDHVPLWDEMPRYLLFLVRDDKGVIRGHPDGCAVPILVTTDNQYVVRWPLDRITLDEGTEELVQEFHFHGAGAFIDLREETSIRREQIVEEQYLAEADDGRHRYTRGIPLSDFRQLLGEENLTRDRIQRGR